VAAAEASMRGPGVYRARDFQGSWLDEMVVVNGSHLSVLNADGSLVKLDRPRYQGLLCQFGARDWYDHDELAAAVEKVKSDPAWVDSQWAVLREMVDRWTWKCQDMAPAILAGLCVATWVQDVWRWRPQVAIKGASTVGKSAFCSFLFGNDKGERGIFGDVALLRSNSSAAGVRQSIGQTSRATCIDEFDGLVPKVKDEILKMIRSAGPGDTIAMGSTSHKAVEFGLRLIFWLAGISVKLDEQPDRTRFILFEMLKPPAERYAAWREPQPDEKHALMISTLAIAIVNAIRAAQMSRDIYQSVRSDIVQDRVIEGLAAPACLMALSLGGDREVCVQTLQAFVDSITSEEKEENHQETHVELVEQIMAMTIPIGNMMQASVGAVLSKVDFYESEFRDQVEAQLGVTRKPINGIDSLVVYPGTIARRLGLGRSEVSQNLRRIDGAASRQTKIAKINRFCVLIPWEWVDRKFYHDDSLPEF
jgi:hypothetical protein